MNMQIKAFACLTGVSVRTLHYYDEIGLLSPAQADAQTGYRYYDESSLERMQQILFYRGLGFPLKRIARLLTATEAERKAALARQKRTLQAKKARLERQIRQLEDAEREGIIMNTQNGMNGASLTALMSAFGRAFHQQTAAKPIFADTLAKGLMTQEEYSAMAGYILGGIDFLAPEKKGSFAGMDEALAYLVNTQIAPTPIARARFCEDSLRAAVQTGTQQIVLLGAGLDTLAFRAPELVGRCNVFEVDHPATQADKLERVRRAGWVMPENLRFAAVDFAKDDLGKALLDAGFEPGKKTFFSWLGVSYYLAEEEIGRMLDSVAALSAQGSTLLFDFADEGLFESKVRRVQNMLAMAAAGGEPMKSCFSYEALERLLERHGFLIYELLTPQEIQARYFAGRTDGLSAFEHIGYATAVYRTETRP